MMCSDSHPQNKNTIKNKDKKLTRETRMETNNVKSNINNQQLTSATKAKLSMDNAPKNAHP